MLSKESGEEMIKQLDSKIYPKYQINVSPEDLFKGGVAVSRAVSNQAIKIMYTFEKIPRGEAIQKRRWNGVLKHILDEIESFNGGAELVEKLKSLLQLTLNSPGIEIGQWIVHAINVFGLAGLSYRTVGQRNTTDNNDSALQLQPIDGPQNIRQAQLNLFQQLSQLVVLAQERGPNSAAALQAILGLQAQIEELAFQLQQQQADGNDEAN